MSKFNKPKEEAERIKGDETIPPEKKASKLRLLFNAIIRKTMREVDENLKD